MSSLKSLIFIVNFPCVFAGCLDGNIDREGDGKMVREQTASKEVSLTYKTSKIWP